MIFSRLDVDKDDGLTSIYTNADLDLLSETLLSRGHPRKYLTQN